MTEQGKFTRRAVLAGTGAMAGASVFAPWAAAEALVSDMALSPWFDAVRAKLIKSVAKYRATRAEREWFWGRSIPRDTPPEVRTLWENRYRRDKSIYDEHNFNKDAWTLIEAIQSMEPETPADHDFKKQVTIAYRDVIQAWEREHRIRYTHGRGDPRKCETCRRAGYPWDNARPVPRRARSDANI